MIKQGDSKVAIRWNARRGVVALVIMCGAAAVISVACGGSSASTAATPTARPLPSGAGANGNGSFRQNGTPGPDFTPGAAGRFQSGFFGGLSESDLADFLGISQDQLLSELQAEGATLATVAQAHGKSRDDLQTFLTDALTKNIPNTVQQMMDGNMRMQFTGPAATSVPGH